MKTQNPSIFRSLGVGLAVVLGILFFAYGFQVTDISLEETRDPRRQESLTRVLRAIAQPAILEYEKEEFIVTHPIWISCPSGGVDVPEPETDLPYLIITPPCADPRDEITIEGFNFEPNTKGPINLIPPSGVTLQLGNAEVDSAGHFIATVTLPNRQPVDEPQEIRVVTRRNVGVPKFTRTAHDTWDKIVETVFMALLATAFGTLLAVPISFFAARNLMKEVTSPLSVAALSILAWPVGIFAGLQISRWLSGVNEMFTANLSMNLGGLIVAPAVSWFAARWAIHPVEEHPPALPLRIVRFVVIIVAAFLGVLSVRLLGNLAFVLGDSLSPLLGPFGFVGTFISDLGEITTILVSAVVVLGVGAFVGGVGSQLGQALYERLPKLTVRLLNFPLGAAAGAVLFAILGGVVDWLYQFNDPALTLWWPAGVGAVLGAFVALRAWQEDVMATGLAVYYVFRTILNALRSIEALIMVIVFAVWVSIGPFAGVLALSLHTIAALAKLYSEQVESILPGPLEAVKATGATRLQMIVYAVIPQIIPPYISFTIYRWDINVRMSTIIGFAGGGGIGFLLQQNINLLNYRAASAQMFAIAIVVATMDYISSWLRERVV